MRKRIRRIFDTCNSLAVTAYQTQVKIRQTGSELISRLPLNGFQTKPCTHAQHPFQVMHTKIGDI